VNLYIQSGVSELSESSQADEAFKGGVLFKLLTALIEAAGSTGE
jgi:hypothetical protein